MEKSNAKIEWFIIYENSIKKMTPYNETNRVNSIVGCVS